MILNLRRLSKKEGSFVATIPKNDIRFYNLENGDVILVEVKEIKKKVEE